MIRTQDSLLCCSFKDDTVQHKIWGEGCNYHFHVSLSVLFEILIGDLNILMESHFYLNISELHYFPVILLSGSMPSEHNEHKQNKNLL